MGIPILLTTSSQADSVIPTIGPEPYRATPPLKKEAPVDMGCHPCEDWDKPKHVHLRSVDDP